MAAAVDGQAKDAALSIGLVLAGIIVAIGGFSGCGINPSRVFAPMLMNTVAGKAAPWELFPVYLIAPIISPWLEKSSKKDIKLFLGLWCVTLFFPLLNPFVSINTSTYSSFYYICGFAGYFLLGFYIHRYPTIHPLWSLIPFFIIPFGCAGFIKFKSLEIDFYSVFWYQSIFVVIMCYAWYNLLLKTITKISIPMSLSRLLSELSNCSFGMYLMHIFLMRRWIWFFPYFREPNGGILQTFLIFITTFIVSFLITYLISLLPFSNYIIGYSRTKNISKNSRKMDTLSHQVSRQPLKKT